MNRQEILDAVILHARKQGRKAQVPRSSCKDDDDLLCVYRSPDGCKCFMGVLIEDKEYRHYWERMDIMMVLDDNRCPQSLISRLDPTSNRVFLPELQNIHDMSYVHQWEEKFKALANIYELQYTPPPS